MDIPKEIFTKEAQKLLFDTSDIEKLVKPLNRTHLFFFARTDANPPWLQSKEQFQFSFLTFYDDKKGQIVIEGIRAALMDHSFKRPKQLAERNFWASEGKLPSKNDMISQVLIEKNKKLQTVEEVRKKFELAPPTAKALAISKTGKRGKSMRG